MKSLRFQSADLGGEDIMGKSGALVTTNATLIPLLAQINLKKRGKAVLLTGGPQEARHGIAGHAPLVSLLVLFLLIPSIQGL